jgi:hypothetical protein
MTPNCLLDLSGSDQAGNRQCFVVEAHHHEGFECGPDSAIAQDIAFEKLPGARDVQFVDGIGVFR